MSEMRQMFKQIGFDIDEAAMRQIFELIDTDNSGSISMEEFVDVS
jgi:Ca2+-binding EF-hand superfamily protein